MIPLPAHPRRWHNAVVELQHTLSGWNAPQEGIRGWMLSAQALLTGSGHLELYVEFDPVDSLLSVELWDEQGRRQFGIDDYLGMEGLRPV